MARVCSHCGAPLKPRALACRECGSDQNTGWSPLGDTESFGTASFDDSDYDEFLVREGLRPAPKRRRRSLMAIGSLVLVLILALLIAVL